VTPAIAKQFMDEIMRLDWEILDAINQLDEAGIISNNVVLLSDIPDVDALNAIEFLKKQ
jgi:hypothetical protein